MHVTPPSWLVRAGNRLVNWIVDRILGRYQPTARLEVFLAFHRECERSLEDLLARVDQRLARESAACE